MAIKKHTTKQHNNYNERRNKTRMWNCTFTIKKTVRILQRKIRHRFLWHTKNVFANGKAKVDATMIQNGMYYLILKNKVETSSYKIIKY